MTDLPVLDLDDMLDRVGGDEALMRDVLGVFLDEAAGMTASARAAVAARDAAAVERAAHSLKGALLNVSAPRAAALAHRLEQLARAGELGEAPVLVDRLGEELGRLEAEMRAALGDRVRD